MRIPPPWRGPIAMLVAAALTALYMQHDPAWRIPERFGGVLFTLAG